MSALHEPVSVAIYIITFTFIYFAVYVKGCTPLEQLGIAPQPVGIEPGCLSHKHGCINSLRGVGQEPWLISGCVIGPWLVILLKTKMQVCVFLQSHLI